MTITCRVPPQNEAAFEDELRELMQIAAAQPKRIAGEVLRGTPGPGGRDYHIVYRFMDEASLSQWESSPERIAIVSRIEALTTPVVRRELTGLEAWSDLPPGLPPPSRHRMALLTWIAIWPLVTLALAFFTPHLAGLPFLARTGATTALVVVLMTYVVMPKLANLARPWLQPSQR